MRYRPVPTIAAIASCLLVAACSSSGEDDTADAETAPVPVLTSNPVVSEAPDGSLMAEGEWFIEEDARGASARFGSPGSEARLSLICDAATQTLTLARAGDAESTQTMSSRQAERQRAST